MWRQSYISFKKKQPNVFMNSMIYEDIATLLTLQLSLHNVVTIQLACQSFKN